MTNKEKNSYFQMIRGICIIFVVLIHLPNGMNYNINAFEYNFWVAERCILNCAVPMFFALSGYFFNKEKVNLKRLIIPFLIWGTFYVGVSAIYGNSLDIKEIIKILTGQTAPHLYFIFVLLQINILGIFLKSCICANKRNTIVLIILTIFCYILYYLINVFNVIDISLPFSFADMFFSWIWYWYIGLLLRENKIKLLSKVSLKTFIIVVFLLILQLIESKWLSALVGSGVSLPVSQLKITNIISATGVILLVFKMEQYVSPKKLGAKIANIGDCSYGIYYIHWIFILIFNRMTSSLNANFISLQIIGLGFVIICSLIVINLVRKIFSRKIAKKYFGF